MSMMKHFYLILFSTLLVGFFSGVFVFFMTREPEVSTPPDDTQTGFEVVVSAYGGCERIGCSFYRISEDGTYTLVTQGLESQNERLEGEVTGMQREDLKGLMDETDFAEVAASRFEGECPIIYDGVAYRFEIQKEGNNYSFDSCREDLELPLFIELESYFDAFRSIHEDELEDM